MEHLIGKVVRLHSQTQPDRFKLYMVMDNEYDGYANGHVRHTTVDQWIRHGLAVTVYEETNPVEEMNHE